MNKLALFEGKNIRRIWHNEEWYFSVVDVIGALTESVDAKDYWYRLKQREREFSQIELSTICRQLKLVAEDDKELEQETGKAVTSKENYLHLTKNKNKQIEEK